MTFQFLCPQGHLLEGEEEHMGMQCQCPQCGTAFIIPTIAHAGSSAGVDSVGAQEAEIGLAPLGPPDVMADAAPPALDGRDTSNVDLSEIAAEELGKGTAIEPMLHIPCPNGHELETPMDMVGQRALCPHCGVEFRLKREKSVEYQKAQELVDRKRARFWFQLAVMAATFVVLVLLVMIGITLFSN